MLRATAEPSTSQGRTRPDRQRSAPHRVSAGEGPFLLVHRVVHLRGRLSHLSPEVRRLLTLMDTRSNEPLQCVTGSRDHKHVLFPR